MSDLQRALANSQIQYARSRRPSDPDENSPWNREQWASARRDILAGTYELPEMRFPVVISPDGPLSSAEQLQQLLESETLPETIETVVVEDDSDSQGAGAETRVVVCDVNYDEKERLLERTEAMDAVTGSITVLFRGGPRYAVVVKALKEGISPERRDGDANTNEHVAPEGKKEASGNVEGEGNNRDEAQH